MPPFPVATLMASQRSPAAYDDIPEYEKENNLIILPPNPVKDEDGNYNALKIPVTPGLSNLMAIVRRQVEGTNQLNPETFAKAAGDLLSAATSINFADPSKLLSTFTPQAIKPFIEDTTNTNLFTKQKIVPEYMKNLPANEQVKSTTSNVSKAIGGLFGISPLRVENFVSTAFAGVGRQLLGKTTIPGEFDRRFFSAKGGEQVNKIYQAMDADKPKTAVLSGEADGQLANFAKVLKFDEYLGENPYTGIKAKAWEEEQMGIARKLYEGKGDYATVPEEVKQRLYERLGTDEKQVEYDFSAAQSENIRSEYLFEELQGQDHKDVLTALAAGRLESITGKKLVSDGVLDSLYEFGLISDVEKKQLKKVKLDKTGKLMSTSGSGDGGLTKTQTKSLLSLIKNSQEELAKGIMKPPKLEAPKKTAKASAKPVAVPKFKVGLGSFKVPEFDTTLPSEKVTAAAPKVKISGKVISMPKGTTSTGLKISRGTFRPRILKSSK
ncbi:hypothetical protein M1307_02855 [Patescibacteria group bacterium]|nr:hypothetical protein [Patescibacteria group bacterium]